MIRYSGETDLTRLLASMEPRLNPGRYVFCRQPDDPPIPADKLIGLFREDEGLTIIMEKKEADALGLAYDYVAAWITLTVHSSLEAVGLTAAFASALAEGGVSCNVAAALCHDHVFVAADQADKALAILTDLARRSKD